MEQNQARFTVMLAMSEPLNEDQKRRLAKHVHAALEAARMEGCYLEEEDDPYVAEVFEVVAL